MYSASSPVSLFRARKPPSFVCSASSYPEIWDIYPNGSSSLSVPSLNFLNAKPEAVLISITSPSILQSMCPFTPSISTSFCSEVMSCPANFTNKRTTSSRICPYKNLINTEESKGSCASFSDFKSYQSWRIGFPTLLIRRLFLLDLSLGCDQFRKTSFIAFPKLSISSSVTSSAVPSLSTAMLS